MWIEDTVSKIMRKWGKLIKISFHNASSKEVVVKMSVTQKKRIEEVTIISDGKDSFEVCVQEVCPCMIHQTPSSALIDPMDEEESDDIQSGVNKNDEVYESDDALSQHMAHTHLDNNEVLKEEGRIVTNTSRKEVTNPIHNYGKEMVDDLLSIDKSLENIGTILSVEELGGRPVARNVIEQDEKNNIPQRIMEMNQGEQEDALTQLDHIQGENNQVL